MKFTSVLVLLATAMAVTAAPLADAAPFADAAPLADAVPAPVADAAPVADLDAAAISVEARDLTRAQCKAACDRGADAVEAFCRRIPIRDLRVRAACWAAATAVQSPLGQRACLVFCDAWF